eukprot:Plantae.Rhodophyta-Hildenbrandia_rubra.ctg14941.p1 GENE.Plantae.Rhodophyta-Hildenbrandia_rubra.ctg14941~~Plantae.Rhodophyta-Hildenbrandia_rubra.ctg14941.p1  ORF type:complete len:541 (-),score=24.16 Plantae.Rhodophyta-Hildenbrandia_rubra.ctg14941:2870-4492(-)
MALPTTPHHFLLLLSLSIIIHLTVSTATPPHHYRISRHPSFHGFARRYIDECLSNIECPPYRYCTFNSTGSNAECAFTSCDAMPRRCVPRLTLDKTCQIGAGDCSNGLYCAFDVFGTSIEPACARKIPKGGACDTSATEPCVGDLVCDNKDKVCAVKKGFQGDKCQNDRDCRQDEGIYCKFVQFPQGPQDFEGTCAKKKGEGEVCGKSADNFECLDGFCLQVFGDTSVGGICLKRRSVGQVCSDDIQCRKVVLKGPRDPPILCNGIRSSGGGNVKGICIPETMLIRKPGAWCNPKMDRCDARRSLQCGRFRWRSVCLQRSQFGQFCTRGSRFSTCLTESIGAPLECRRQLALTSKAPYKSDVCSRVREVVKRGEICNREEHAICEEGSACVAGPGIQGEADKFAPPPLAYCMKSVPVGSDCRRKYDTVCASGSFCIGNKCTAASTPPVVPVTLSGISVDCSSRPCAPGLVCVTSNGNKQCDVPTVNAGLGESCFDTATKKKVSHLHVLVLRLMLISCALPSWNTNHRTSFLLSPRNAKMG